VAIDALASFVGTVAGVGFAVEPLLQPRHASVMEVTVAGDRRRQTEDSFFTISS
jgi:hypothetical protein